MKNIIPFGKPQGEARHFDELVRPHVDHLYRVAYRFHGNQHDAEDLVQDLLIKLYAKKTELDQVEQLRPWLVKSLYRLYIDHLRRDKRSPIAFSDEDNETASAPTPTSEQPEEELDREQRQNLIFQALERLSEEHRALIVLCDIEGYSIPEAQQVLDLPGGTIKSRLHRARAKLRELLKNRI